MAHGCSPIPNDYTIADLHSAPPECIRSYELLKALADEKENLVSAPAVGLSEQDTDMIQQVTDIIKKGDYSEISEILQANADGIEQAWQSARKARDTINELNTFPEIADLTEPALEAKLEFLPNLIRLSTLYEAHVYLQCYQGNYPAAVNELVTFDSVFRKLSINARSIVVKLACFTGLKRAIITANFITNAPNTPKETLQFLADHFKPLHDQISLKNCFVFAYLFCKNTLHAHFGEITNKHSTFVLKPNSTLRLLRNYYDPLIRHFEKSKNSATKQFTIWPLIYADYMPEVGIQSEREPWDCWQYKYYNPAGCLFITIMIPAWGSVVKYMTEIETQDDLFQIVLNKRLGNKVGLKARAYSDEYIIDVENKMIFSPGPDGKPYTEDDIKLPINPDVLNLTR